jgi:hypothetical protein
MGVMQIAMGLGLGMGMEMQTTALPLYSGQDDFTDDIAGTLLSDLIATMGSWSRHPLSTGEATITTGADALQGPSAASRAVVATIAQEQLGRGVFVELDMMVKSNNSSLTSNAVARVAGDSLTFLAAGYNGVSWRIIKYINDTPTVLATYSLAEAKAALLSMRFEVSQGEQRLYRNGELLLTTANLGSLGNGLGLRLGSISTGWTSETGAPIRAIRS